MTREAHPSLRGVEEVGVLLGPDRQRLASGGAKGQFPDVATDTAVHVVVLAVHVRGDHAAERHELRARHHRAGPVLAQCEVVDLAERNPRFGPQHSRIAIEMQDPAGAFRPADDSSGTRRKRGVAVGPSESAEERRVGCQSFEVVRLAQVGFDPGIPAPPFQRDLRH